MKRLIDWLDRRTGIRQITHEALYENIPSGARLRYVTGSMLVFAFVTQMITGVVLWMAYSPSSTTAWESVYYIQHEMVGGWFLRGVHHFMAQAMVVLLGMHMLQVIVDKAYQGPREINFWLGLILMQLILGLALTGYLLPWDQKGYWATSVATNLMALVPFGIGEKIQQLVIGGSDYGNATLTRFFAMHGGVLPMLTLIFLGMHISAFRKHGITARITPGRADQTFWPHQVLYDGIGCLVLVVVVVLLTINFDVGSLFAGNLSGEHHGAELGAPADPSEPYGAARPEWYFLFLFQFLKFFEGELEIVGAIVIPGALMGFMFLMPLVAKFKGGHALNVAFFMIVLAGAGVLTGLALNEDRHNEEYIADKKEADQNAERINELAQRRVRGEDGELGPPLMFPDTALDLLRNDPLTQGPKLFDRNCSSCHNYDNPNEDSPDDIITRRYQMPVTVPSTGGDPDAPLKVLRDSDGNVVYREVNGAPNLYGFATRDWIRRLLDPEQIDAVTYLPPELSAEELQSDDPAKFRREITGAPVFGNTAHREGRMVDWVQKHLGNEKWMKANLGEGAEDEQQNTANQKKNLDAIIAALSAQANVPAQAAEDEAAHEQIAHGVGLIKQLCTSCHRFGGSGQLGLAPDLTGYGSYAWTMGIVSDPTHQRFYRRGNDRMPSFAADLDNPADNALSVREISLIVDWLRGDYYRQDDEDPRLPHTAQQARETVLLSRATEGQLVPAIAHELIDEVAAQESRARHIFTLNCAACHSYVDQFGHGIHATNPSAPNLHDFASRDWLTGFLDPNQIRTPHYFGNTKHASGQMVEFVESTLADLDEEDRADIDKLIVALSAAAKLPSQAKLDEEAADSIQAGIDAMETWTCTECHQFGELGEEGLAPVLTDYGSAEWLKGMISDPTHERYYGASETSNDRMPRFRQSADSLQSSLLSEEELDLLVKLLRGELESSDE